LIRQGIKSFAYFRIQMIFNEV